MTARFVVVLGLVTAALGAGCGGESHPCDQGTPTCESTLVVLLPDARTEFRLRVSDERGLNVDVTCPLADTAADTVGAYTMYCAAGRLQIDTYEYFGDTVQVQLEEAEARTFEPRHSRGADYCGNSCTQGTIQL